MLSIKRNLGLKILALISALLIWGYVRYSQTLWREAGEYLTLSVPLTFNNLSLGMEVLEAPKIVNLTLKGVPELLKNLKPSEFSAYVDLTGRQEGPYSLEIRVNTPPGINVVYKEPAKAAFQVDSVDQKVFPVEVRTTEALPPGRVLEGVKAMPSEVELSGPRSLLEQVKKVEASVNLSWADTYLNANCAVLPVNQKGLRVSGLKAEPASVLVEVMVALRMRPKTLPVNPQLAGSLPPGFTLSRLEVNPPVVTVNLTGRLEQKLDFLATEAISLEGARKSFGRKVKLVLPTGVSPLGEDHVEVKLEISRLK